MSDLAAGWTKSSFCADSACVEVAVVGGNVLVRDSKNVDLPVLNFSQAAWDDFRAALTANEFSFD